MVFCEMTRPRVTMEIPVAKMNPMTEKNASTMIHPALLA